MSPQISKGVDIGRFYDDLVYSSDAICSMEPEDNMTDFPPIADDEWPDEIADLRGGFATKLNVYRTMAHNPRLLAAWAPLRQHIVVDNALGRQLSEVVILRTGHRLGSPYEWAHHVSQSRACGMDDARIASIAGEVGAMETDDAILAQAVDELFDRKSLRGETREKVIALVGTDGLFDVIATVGFYSTLGYIVESFATPLDVDIERELRDNPCSVD